MAMETVVHTDAQAVANGRVRELPPDGDPYMTREARAARAEWRRAHLAEWHRELKGLIYYDPDYAYSPAHEYSHELWTTDPDRHGDGVQFFEFDEDGVLEATDDRRTLLEAAMLALLRLIFGHRVESQARLLFGEPVATELELFTPSGRPSSLVKPDLLLFPEHRTLPPGQRYRETEDRFVDMRDGEPPPQLAVEILSKSSGHRDLVEKYELYAKLGVEEYWICDVGGMRQRGSPAGLLVYRLSDLGFYGPVTVTPDSEPPVPAFVDTPVWSEVCGTRVCLQADAYEPRFRWWDSVQDRWRDADTEVRDERDRRDKEVRDEALTEGEAIGEARGREQGLAEGEAIGEARMAMGVMKDLLGATLAPVNLDRIEEHWRTKGPPADLMGFVRAVQQAPGEWRDLLGIPDDDRTRPPDDSW